MSGADTSARSTVPSTGTETPARRAPTVPGVKRSSIGGWQRPARSSPHSNASARPDRQPSFRVQRAVARTARRSFRSRATARSPAGARAASSLFALDGSNLFALDGSNASGAELDGRTTPRRSAMAISSRRCLLRVAVSLGSTRTWTITTTGPGSFSRARRGAAERGAGAERSAYPHKLTRRATARRGVPSGTGDSRGPDDDAPFHVPHALHAEAPSLGREERPVSPLRSDRPRPGEPDAAAPLLLAELQIVRGVEPMKGGATT